MIRNCAVRSDCCGRNPLLMRADVPNAVWKQVVMWIARPAPHAGFALLIALLAVAAGGKAILYDTIDPDCFWHLKVASQMQQDGVGPLVDRLSFASVQTPWTPYSWLAELAMKATWDRGGYRAAVLAQALLQSAFVVAVALACRAARPAWSPRCRFLPAPASRTGCGTPESSRLAAAI